MIGIPGIQELLFMILIICVLSMSGLWPTVIKGLRELRGEQVDDEVSDGSSRGGARPSGGAGALSRTDLELCYRLLGVSSSASWEEVEKAYRNKAKIHHPDRGGDADTMRALNEAYNMLKRIHRGR